MKKLEYASAKNRKRGHYQSQSLTCEICSECESKKYAFEIVSYRNVLHLDAGCQLISKYHISVSGNK